MRHKAVFVSAIGTLALALAACGGGQVTVQVLTEGADGTPRPQGDLVIHFLPYDRDSVFDALTEVAAEPEPQVPSDLQVTFDSVTALQERWREVDTQWADVRDSLRQLSNRLQGMDRRSREYRQLFDRFGPLENREGALNRQKTQAFEAFTNLQQRALARADSIRAVRESWGDVAFQDYNSIEDSILEAVGKEVYEDTTSAEGIVTRRLPAGSWWVHTRVPVGMFDEFYWNERVDPAQVDTLRLTSENADRRLRL